MAEYYLNISRFVDDNRALSVGRVNESLCNAIDVTMSEYKSFIIELEKLHINNRLHLQLLWYHIQSIMQILEVFNRIAVNISKQGLRGGATLSYLIETSYQYLYDRTHINLFKHLIKQASIPYMESIKEWIFNGNIFDPFDEFMIIEKDNLSFKDCQSLEQWEKKYQIRHISIPSFLNNSSNEIWKAGLYLNVVRENIVESNRVNLAEIEDIKYSSKVNKYLDIIKRAYIHSSSSLLYYMLDKYKLVQRFGLMKKYFLIQQGDFIAQILDTCDKELCKPVFDIIPSRLKTLVDMAIRGTECTLSDDITISLQSQDLWNQVTRILAVNSSMTTGEQDQKNVSLNSKLTGYESFTLNINCKWPVSFLFNTRVISSYQMLFRLLFYCKHVEHCLLKVWIIDQTLRKQTVVNQKHYSIFFSLRHRMIYFIQNIQYYMMEEAIEPNWIQFQQQLKQINSNIYSIDHLLEHHKIFLDKCISDCLLSNSIIFPIFMKLLALCKEFATLIIENENKLVNMETNEKDEFMNIILKSEREFHQYYMNLLTSITEFAPSQTGNKILEILQRANFNHYFI
ncbi:hypothetical protein O3M35_002390 [Rhynocoris fuscipes]|uniref:Gamma-tubulin complex component n=1 Tax=Rhynocoris fuscipes TaxID=488301 RepID=A0AAW1CLM3_9HEMI